MQRVLIIGAAGLFGSHLAERLAMQPGLQLLLGGRDLARALQLVTRLQPAARAALEPVVLDLAAPDLAACLATLAPQVVVDAAGPFQGQAPRLAEACIAQGVHAIDLADSRAYVQGITRLDAAARAAGVLVASGASSVPALSGAAIDAMAADLARLHSIQIGISPGNRTERGLSTVQAVLSGVGLAMPGRTPAGRPAWGWSGSWTHDYPAPVGRRRLSPCDVPDLALWPERYAGRPWVCFGAGLELGLLHRGLNLLAWLTRHGTGLDWRRHAGWMKALADLFRQAGSEAGAMHVELRGEDAQGHARRRRWTLMAEAGHGPYVPTLAAGMLVRRLLAGRIAARGAMPCVGLLTLDDFAEQAQGLRIHWRTEELPA